MIFFRNSLGQSLAEVLVATAVTSILIVAGIVLISPVIRGGKNISSSRMVGALNRELIEKTRSYAESDWRNIFNLSTGSINRYYLSTSTSQFTIFSGTEAVTIGSSTYSRYFYVDEIIRDADTLEITTSTVNSIPDPSTRKVTVVVVGSQNVSSSVSQILTRFNNTASFQSDWSGGSGYEGPATGTVSQFSSGSNINTTSTPGSIILNNL